MNSSRNSVTEINVIRSKKHNILDIFLELIVQTTAFSSNDSGEVNFSLLSNRHKDNFIAL